MASNTDRLSKHFTLREMTTTSSGLPNQPASPQVLDNLRSLCSQILEPVRAHYERPVIIHSGYRSPDVNKAVGGSSASQHVKGEAVDFHVSGHSVYDLAMWISNTLDYDQLILENFLPGIPTSGWVHCSFARNNRGQDLTKFKGSKMYHPGIILKPE